GADLRGTNLNQASLSWANLRGTNLVGVDMSGANLVGADLPEVRRLLDVLAKAVGTAATRAARAALTIFAAATG
ncbi:MAG: pentapeptide repeat-containing protein, partial [Chloroflexi bacterium]|nr:pentapeptide repeat-containing protein [Chloroflexota bacterium]